MPRRAKPAAAAPLRVAELFAGVGGFRIGLERAGGYRVVWSDQWEPGKKKQHASEVYAARFGPEGHLCQDIATVKAKEMPAHDLLVGGFPCQDYSVATTLRNAKGLLGRKGVLWWQIHRLLSELGPKRPRYLLLENVDRLLGSPAGQRGRDFAVMLNTLNALGYAVEWRVINAADYGMPQRRRRVFIYGWRDGGKPFTPRAAEAHLVKDGPFATAFPVQEKEAAVQQVRIDGDVAHISSTFNRKGTTSPFLSAGVMRGGVVHTAKVTPAFSGKPVLLGDVLQPEADVPKAFFVPKGQLKRWKYLKGAKKEARMANGGTHKYHYSEGAMAFPDALDKPARTIITGEGGPSPSRFKHVVATPSGRFRRLTPIELERLNMFPDGHTAGAPDGWRAFFMGNALVTGVVERIARELTRRQA